jgi:hypothetical protein
MNQQQVMYHRMLLHALDVPAVAVADADAPLNRTEQKQIQQLSQPMRLVVMWTPMVRMDVATAGVVVGFAVPVR